MIAHAYVPHPVWKRDQCEFKYDDEGRVGFCGKPRSEHMDSEHALRVQLAAAFKERDEAIARAAKAEAESVIHQEARTRLARERNDIGEALAAEKARADAEAHEREMAVSACVDWSERWDARETIIASLRTALDRAKMQVKAIKPTRASAETLRIIDAALAAPAAGEQGKR